MNQPPQGSAHEHHAQHHPAHHPDAPMHHTREAPPPVAPIHHANRHRKRDPQDAALYIAAGTGLVTAANNFPTSLTQVSSVIQVVIIVLGCVVILRGSALFALPQHLDAHAIEHRVLQSARPLRPVAVLGLVTLVVFQIAQALVPSGPASIVAPTASELTAITAHPTEATNLSSGGGIAYLSNPNQAKAAPTRRTPSPSATPSASLRIAVGASASLPCAPAEPSVPAIVQWRHGVISHGLLPGFPAFGSSDSARDSAGYVKVPAGADGFYTQDLCLPALVSARSYQLRVRVSHELTPVDAYIDVFVGDSAVSSDRFTPCGEGQIDCDAVRLVDLGGGGRSVTVRVGASSPWPTAPTMLVSIEGLDITH